MKKKEGVSIVTFSPQGGTETVLTPSDVVAGKANFDDTIETRIKAQPQAGLIWKGTTQPKTDLKPSETGSSRKGGAKE